MTQRILLTAVLMVCWLFTTATATVPDTIRVGYNEVYYVGEGRVRVPLVYFNDNDSVGAVQFPLRYACSSGLLTPDSVTRAGRTYGTQIFNLILGMQGGGETNPDSTCVTLVTLWESLPPGDGIIANLWFTGAYPGDVISFLPVNDTLGPNCYLLAQPPDPDGGPIHVRNDIIVTDGGVDIVAGSEFTIEALNELRFPVDVYSGTAPYTLQVVSLVGPNMVYPIPSIAGSGPWEFRWRPGSANSGDYTLTLGATDSAGLYTDHRTTIHVTPAPPDECDIVRGDMTCDSVIDIADLVYLASWMFTGGPPPDCPGTKFSSADQAVADTIRFGWEGVQYIGAGHVIVPIYYYNDNEPIAGVQFPFKYESTGDSLYPDSLTHAGRSFGGAAFDLGMFVPNPADGNNPDSTCIGMISLTKSLPAGAGVVGELWFSGVAPEDTISFSGIAFSPPYCYFESSPPDPEGGPIIVESSHAVGDPAGMYLSCGFNFGVGAFQDLNFPISIFGGEAPHTLEILSFTGPSNPIGEGTLTGDGPWEFSWTPNNGDAGVNILTLRASDDSGLSVEREIFIWVEEVTASHCDFLRGDTDCDGQVTISDLIFEVTHMFNGGPEPDCGQ